MHLFVNFSKVEGGGVGGGINREGAFILKK